MTESQLSSRADTHETTKKDLPFILTKLVLVFGDVLAFGF